MGAIVTDLARSRLRWLAFRPHPHRVRDFANRVIGRRGGALIASGILWIFIGISVTHMPIPIGRPLAPHEYIPADWRAAGWMISGALAILCGFLWRTVKGPDGIGRLDRIGFALLIVMPTERVISWLIVLAYLAAYGWGIPVPYIPLPGVGPALSGAAVWSVVTVHTLILQGWNEAAAPIDLSKLGESGG